MTRLRPLGDWPEAEVQIRTTDELVFVDFGPRSSVRRQLAVGPDCVNRASSAALVIATWMDDLPAQVTRASVLREEATKAATPPAPPGLDRCEIGAGLSATGGGGWAPGLRAEVIRLRDGHNVGWQASLDVVGPRTLSINNGDTHWMRTSVAAGLHGRHAFERFLLAADLGLAGAYTVTWGTGYSNNASDDSFPWGPVAADRAGASLGRFVYGPICARAGGRGAMTPKSIRPQPRGSKVLSYQLGMAGVAGARLPGARVVALSSLTARVARERKVPWRKTAA